MSATHVRVRVGDERYAVAVEHVLEVAEIGELGLVPGTRPDVLGVRNLHGHVLPVFDLGRILSAAGDSDPRRMVVAVYGDRSAGLAVDEVTGVERLDGELEEADSRFVRGAVLEDGHLVGRLDLRELFAALEHD